MKMTSRLIALALVCVGIPATVVAQPPKKLTGKWKMEFTGPDMPGISAFSICEANGRLITVSYQRFPSILGIGAGTLCVSDGKWVQRGDNIQVSFQTKLPDNRSQRVVGTALLSESGAEVRGSAEAQFLREDGTVLYSTHVTVTGERV
jgi:hypothetical protein